MPFWSPKSSKMWSKRTPKCLIGTGEIELGTTLATSSPVFGLKDTFTVSQKRHFGPIWRPVGPHFLPLQAVLTRQFCQQSTMHSSYNVVHCSQLIDRSPTFVLILAIHNSVAEVTEHPSHFSFDVPAFKAHTCKNQQNTYKYEQAYVRRIIDHQARTQHNH